MNAIDLKDFKQKAAVETTKFLFVVFVVVVVVV